MVVPRCWSIDSEDSLICEIVGAGWQPPKAASARMARIGARMTFLLWRRAAVRLQARTPGARPGPASLAPRAGTPRPAKPLPARGQQPLDQTHPVARADRQRRVVEVVV